jgi:formate dehydrogenase iron-sulfur subunit
MIEVIVMSSGKAFLIDTTLCTACRGCQIACKQWNQLPATETHNWGSMQNPKDLSFDTFKARSVPGTQRPGQ